jgi:hypothetical protein
MTRVGGFLRALTKMCLQSRGNCCAIISFFIGSSIISIKERMALLPHSALEQFY